MKHLLLASSECLEATLHANPSVWGKGQPQWHEKKDGDKFFKVNVTMP